MGAYGDELRIVDGGSLRNGSVVEGKWTEEGNSLVSSGRHHLYAARGLGAGDFRIRARLSLDRLDRTAAAIVLAGNQFGFEGSHGWMFVNGPQFGESRKIGDPRDFIAAGKPFDLEVAREGRILTFRIDGQEVWRTGFHDEAVRYFGLRPWRATMRVADFLAEGVLVDALLPEQPKDVAPALAARIDPPFAYTGDRARFVGQLLEASPESLARLEAGRKAGLLELSPVNLPTQPKGDNNHFGWPVATLVEDTMIVVHRAMPGHNRGLSGSADEDTTYSVVVRSTDGGRTWSEPYDVRACMRPEDRNRGGAVPLCHRFKFDPANESPLGYKLHLNAIGVARDGGVVLVSDHGVFRSEDKGATWRHLRKAFREDRHEGPFAYVGPRIIDDPEHGLLLFAHHTLYRNRRPFDIAREIAVYRSRDGGSSWEKSALLLPGWCKPAEPDVIAHHGRFVAIVRNQAPANVLAQMSFQFGGAVIEDVANTPMATRVSVDTSALCFNPQTRRFEVVQSRREDMSIHLYSLAPEDWSTAAWRHEGRLFQRAGKFYKTADGFHTGGAVLDPERGVQHIFFYCGDPGGPAGVFRLTRTLDTPKLARFLKGEGQ